jgi:sugar/nucleoside kinase (ribokinase family)
MVEIFRENFEAFLNEGIDLLFCNEDEAKKYTGKDNLEDAFEDLKEVSKQFVVTVGVDGARVYDGDNFINIPSFPTDVVDTNGAGDMFAGAFLFAITSGFTFKHAGILASMAASKIVSQFGPRLEADQMIEILKDFKEEHY